MYKRQVGLNTYFKSLEYENFDEYEFSARISLLDYDAVVINAEYLITCYSTSYDSSYPVSYTHLLRLLMEYDAVRSSEIF